MRKYLPSGALMDMKRNATGGIDVTVIGREKTFDSIEEALPVIYSDTMEVYSELKKLGIVGNGSSEYFDNTGAISEKLKNPFANTSDMLKREKQFVFEKNWKNKKPEKKTKKKAVTHYTKKANGDYKWEPVKSTTGLPKTATTYETFTPINFNDTPPNTPPPSIVTPEGKLTAPAITLLSLVSYVPADRLKSAEIKETGIEDFYAPWYSRDTPPYGGGITYNNAIHLTENFYDNTGKYGEGSYGNNIYQWLALLSHEVGHLPQEDMFKEAGAGTGGYLVSFPIQYAKAGSHDKAPAELMADMGRINFENFLVDINDGNLISSIFTNKILSDNEKSRQIISLFQKHLDKRIRDLESQKKGLDLKIAEDSQKIIDLNKKIEAADFTDTNLFGRDQNSSLFQMHLDTPMEELESYKNNLELQKAEVLQKITDIDKRIDAMKKYKQTLEVQKQRLN